MSNFTEEKIELMQDKNLLHKLYVLTHCGTDVLSAEENDFITNMILKRRESNWTPQIVTSN